MEINEFIKLRERFEKASTDEKIEIYLTTGNLDKSQYMSLLRIFPRNELAKLEQAME